MSVQVEKLEHNMAKLTIEVPETELEAAIEKAYQKQKKSISLPGFRKGKAPRVMIEKMYGKGVFLEEAANSLIPVQYSLAAGESGLEIVSQPTIDVTQLEPGKSFIFTAEVAVKPEVTLGEYKGVEVEKQNTEVLDEEVEAEILKERESNSRMIDVEDRAVEDGDTVNLDFEGFVDGEAFEGGKGEGYPLVIGSNAFIPGFEEQLIGAGIDEEKVVNVTFPEDYHAEDLKGKEAVFKCKVNRIQKKELPEVDDEFAKDVSEFDTLEEYKADIRKKLAEEKEKDAQRAKEDAVINKIIETTEMDIPDAMVDAQIDQMADDFGRRMQSQGLSLEQYFQFTGLTMEKLRDELKPQALKRIQTRLVLEKIAEVEDIQPTEEQIDEEINKMAEMYKMEADKLKEMLGEYEMTQMKKDMAVQQAVTLVADAAKEA